MASVEHKGAAQAAMHPAGAPSRSTVCAICSAGRRAPFLAKDGFAYTRCTGCGWVRLDPLPGVEESRALYSESYFQRGAAGGYADYAGDEAVHLRNAVARCRLLSRDPGSLVDVGCALGFFLDEARRRGWRVAGVEASSWAAAEARRRDLVVYPSLEELRRAEAGPWDAVTFFQVLEHLSDPAAALGEAHGCLRPGGRVVIETWDRKSLVARLFGRHWQQVSPPSVIHLFARRDLVALLEEAGFELCSVRRTAKRVSAGFVAGLLAGKYPRAMGWLRRAVAAAGLDRLAVPYRLGDLITVMGKRRG